MTFGSKLQSLRDKQGLTQKELANSIGVTTGIVAEWEADEAAPNLAELSRLSKALNVSADILLDSDSVPTTATCTISEQAPRPTVAPVRSQKKFSWVVLIMGLIMIVGAIILLYYGFGFKTNSKPETTTATTNELTTAPTENLTFSDNTKAIEAADESVVTLFYYDYYGEFAGTGSGFIAFDGKTVITNYHVMQYAYSCKVSTNQDITYNAPYVLCYSKELDIAILELEKDTGLQPLPLGDSSVIKKGEKVTAIGSPLGIKNTVSNGVLSGRLMKDNMDVLQFTAPISSGSSGGALFDDNGNVIGITYASYVDGQNLNLAIPVELAKNLYNTRDSKKAASIIYVAEHPYVSQLVKYESYPTITIEELLNNPKKYADKKVKVYGFISSFNFELDLLLQQDTKVCYISSKENITGNGKYDEQTYYAGILRQTPISNIQIYLDPFYEIQNYLSPDAVPGDKICCIGKINYELLEEDNAILFYMSTEMIYNPD